MHCSYILLILSMTATLFPMVEVLTMILTTVTAKLLCLPVFAYLVLGRTNARLLLQQAVVVTVVVAFAVQEVTPMQKPRYVRRPEVSPGGNNPLVANDGDSLYV